MCLVHVAVDGFSTCPDFEPGETTQNIVEIPTMQELVICFFWKLLEVQVVERIHTFGVEFHLSSNSSCVSAYFPARCTACPLLVFVTLQSVHGC